MVFVIQNEDRRNRRTAPMLTNRSGARSHVQERILPSFRQTARLFLRALLALDLAFLAVCAVHSIYDYFHGGWASVEGWYVHLQIENSHLGSAGWQHQWTWVEALRPVLLYAAAVPVLWAISRFLRPPEEDEPDATVADGTHS